MASREEIETKIVVQKKRLQALDEEISDLKKAYQDITQNYEDGLHALQRLHQMPLSGEDALYFQDYTQGFRHQFDSILDNTQDAIAEKKKHYTTENDKLHQLKKQELQLEQERTPHGQNGTRQFR